jgi:hypothetical protein
MLAYLEAGGSLTDILDIAATHPSVSVRAAAIDAYMFNMGDTSAAAATLRGRVQTSDAAYIGRPRMTKTMNVRAFDDQLRSFVATHPETAAGAPRRMGVSRSLGSSCMADGGAAPDSSGTRSDDDDHGQGDRERGKEREHENQ